MTQEIVTAISTVGFPIVMCGALFWYMIKQNEMHQTDSREMKDAINALKIAIIQLTERITKEDEKNNAESN